MKQNLKACGHALTTATVNALLALVLMLLIEFAISGSLQLANAYIWAVIVIGLVIFSAQFWRQRHLFHCCSRRQSGDQLQNSDKLHT
jgi:hypothetical protein